MVEEWAYFLLVTCLAFFSTVKTETICLSETSNFSELQAVTTHNTILFKTTHYIDISYFLPSNRRALNAQFSCFHQNEIFSVGNFSIKSTISWDVTSCSLVRVYICFGRMYCLHLQGLGVSRASKQQTAFFTLLSYLRKNVTFHNLASFVSKTDINCRRNFTTSDSSVVSGTLIDLLLNFDTCCNHLKHASALPFNFSAGSSSLLCLIQLWS
jgi:hypothetical protein